jgi:hypothetical protein
MKSLRAPTNASSTEPQRRHQRAAFALRVMRRAVLEAADTVVTRDDDAEMRPRPPLTLRHRQALAVRVLEQEEVAAMHAVERAADEDAHGTVLGAVRVRGAGQSRGVVYQSGRGTDSGPGPRRTTLATPGVSW